MQSTGFKTSRTHNRKFPGKVGLRPDNSPVRKAEAAARQAESAKRTPQEQLARLDQYRQTASKEREKLQMRIDAAKSKAPEKVARPKRVYGTRNPAKLETK